MLTEEQNNFLKLLQKHGGYLSSNTVEKTNDFLWVEFDGMVYIPNFQFDREFPKTGGTYRDVPYLLSILERKKLSQVRKINFFLSKVGNQRIYELIREEVTPAILIREALDFGELGR